MYARASSRQRTRDVETRASPLWFDGDVTDGGGADRTAEGDDSIWQSDDVPVRADPLEFHWDARRPGADEQVEFDPSVRSAVGPASADTVGRRSAGWQLIAGLAAFAVVAMVIVLAVRSGESDEAATSASTKELDETTSVPETSTDPTSTTTDRNVEADDSPAPIGAIDLPPAVAAIQVPTEIVTVTEQGLVQTVSLPSGRVRSVAVDWDQTGGFGYQQVVVSPEAAAMSTADGGLLIVPRAGPPIAVDASAFDSTLLGGPSGGGYVSGWQSTDDGTAFTVLAYPRQGGSAIPFSVRLDGTVTPSEATGPTPYGYEVVTMNGRRIVNDAGGAYEVQPDGTSRRIDDGFIYAATDDRWIVRRCDEAFQCAVELVTPSTGDRHVIDSALLPENFQSMLYGASLSPDGTALSLQRDIPSTERVLVDLALGEVASSPITGWPQTSQWAADSSGVFDVPVNGSGVQFTGRDGGEPVVFGEELGRISVLGVRWPDAEIEPGVTLQRARFTPPDVGVETGIELVATSSVGGMSAIDIDAGEIVSWERAHRLGRGPTALLPVGDRVAVFPDRSVDAFVADLGGEYDLGEVFIAEGAKLPGPTPDTLWVPSGGETRPNDVVYDLYPITATTPQEAIASIDVVGADLLGADGNGGLVIRRGGDIFVVDAIGAAPLTTGDLIAIGATTAFVRECADVATCSIIRIDRGSGVRAAVTGPLATESGFGAATTDRGASLATSVSPDGSVLVTRLPAVTTGRDGEAEVDEVWAFADTASGQVTFVDDLDTTQPVIWAADGQFAVVLADSTLRLFDRAAGRLVTLGLPSVNAIGSSPAWVIDS